MDRLRRSLERHARNVGLLGPFSPWWLARYYLYRYGHGGAYLILGLACFASLAVVVHVQHRQQDTSDVLARLIKNIQIDRRNSTALVCSSNNQLTYKLRGLIVDGAKQSRPFEKLFRAYGLPGYKARVRRAEAQARSLKIIPCDDLIRRIEEQTPPPPVVP